MERAEAPAEGRTYPTWMDRWGRRRRAPATRLASQSFRYVARRLAADHLSGRRPPVIAISPACPPEIAVDSAAMLAAALASEAKARVLLADGDWRGGALTHHFGATGRRGLSDLVTGARGGGGGNLLLGTVHPQVALLPVGTRAGEALTADRARAGAVLDSLRMTADCVLLLQGAIARDTRTLAFAHAAEAVLLVVEEGRTRLDQIEEAEATFAMHDVERVQILLSEYAGREPVAG